MLLTLGTTHRPATDHGYLLYKNPSRVQNFFPDLRLWHRVLPGGKRRALLLEIDAVGVVRRGNPEARTIEHYVNDRPYVASSLLSVALGEVFRSALSGHREERPQLASTSIPLEAFISSIPCRGGDPLLRGLFEPLGYSVNCVRLSLDETHPEWGESPYFNVKLEAPCRLADLVAHL